MKIEDFISKYGFGNITDPQLQRELTEAYNLLEDVRFAEVASFAKGSVESRAQIRYLKLIAEQNFIMIRQLEEIKNRL